MKTSKTINPGEELTLAYNLYDPCKNYVDANEYLLWINKNKHKDMTGYLISIKQ